MPPRPTTPSSSYRPPSSRGCVMSRTCVTALRRCLSGSGWPLVDPQVSFDDLDGDRGRGVGAETAALNDDADRYLRVVGGRVAGEHRVVQARAADGVLRCSGLARD